MTAHPDAIRREQAELEARYGAWTAHNIRLADGVYTLSEAPAGDEVKLRRVAQIVSDTFAGGIAGLRVLDLACLEGMYALEFARRGAEVVAIEGREANLEKARFAARALGLEVDFRLGDVRELTRQDHGQFDVVLCLGILYHLDAPDVFRLLERMAEVCRRALVIDTSVAARGNEERSHSGQSYRGTTLVLPGRAPAGALELAGQSAGVGADASVPAEPARSRRLHDRFRVLGAGRTGETADPDHARRTQRAS